MALQTPNAPRRKQFSNNSKRCTKTNWQNRSKGVKDGLMECVRLRVKDVDFEMRQMTVRNGKGFKDRVTMLPDSVTEPLKCHLEKVKAIHEQDLQEGYGEVYLPFALARKYPHAGREWGWQYIFPASRRSIDPLSNQERRHHIDEKVLQRAVKKAVRAAGITKPASCHTLRHNAAYRIMPNGCINPVVPLQYEGFDSA